MVGGDTTKIAAMPSSVGARDRGIVRALPMTFTTSIRRATALACLGSFGTFACVSTTYTVPVRGETTQEDRSTTAGPFVAQLNGATASGFTVQLSHPTCQTYDVTPVTETTYSKPSTGGAIGLIAVGAALGALGTASWVGAHDKPSHCDPNDDSCVTRTQAKGIGVLFWGLGAGGVGWGGYRLFEGPSEVDHNTHNETVAAAIPIHDCGDSPGVSGVPVSLGYRLGTLNSQTDDGGNAVFPACGPGIEGGCIDVSQLFSTDQGALSAEGHALGSVNIGQIFGAREPPAPPASVDPAQVLLVAVGICVVKAWGEEKCAEKMGAGACTALEQALTSDQIDLKAAAFAQLQQIVTQNSDFLSSVATFADIVQCTGQMIDKLSQ